MKKSDWEEKLKIVKEGIENSKENMKNAENHLEEGEMIKKAIEEKIKAAIN